MTTILQFPKSITAAWEYPFGGATEEGFTNFTMDESVWEKPGVKVKRAKEINRLFIVLYFFIASTIKRKDKIEFSFN